MENQPKSSCPRCGERKRAANKTTQLCRECYEDIKYGPACISAIEADLHNLPYPKEFDHIVLDARGGFLYQHIVRGVLSEMISHEANPLHKIVLEIASKTATSGRVQCGPQKRHRVLREIKVGVRGVDSVTQL
jgi:hypothetical protein